MNLQTLYKSLITLFILLIATIYGCGSDEMIPNEEVETGEPTDEQQPMVNLPMEEKEEEKDSIDIPEGMVYVPAGDFIMGSDPDRDPLADPLDEFPQHTVYLDAYFIDKFEVSNADYTKFVEATGHRNSIFWDNPKFNHPDQPVVGVTWGDAAAYAEWIDKRLPTEAEWEKASRGTDGRIWPWGNEFEPTKCNFDDDKKFDGHLDGYATAAPVDSFHQGASPYGALHMAGNVSEWVSDWFDMDYYLVSPRENPQGPKTSGMGKKSWRGSSWFAGFDYVRCAYRDYDDIVGSSQIIGFRCAMDAPIQQ